MNDPSAQALTLRQVWFADLGTAGPLEATPIVSNGVVYVTDAGKRLQAFRVGDLPVALVEVLQRRDHPGVAVVLVRRS